MTYPSRRARGRTSGLFPGTFIIPGILGCAILCCSPAAFGQSQTSGVASSPSVTEISDKIDQLTRSLEQTQVELAQSRTEIQELRAALKQVLERTNPGTNGANALTTNAGAQAGEQPGQTGAVGGTQQVATEQSKPAPAQISQDDWDILNARIDEQRQDKVESMSRYRLKLSGLALFTAFSNFGQVDNTSLPSIALPSIPGYSGGSVGASLRQSIIGLTGYGPTLFGAHTSADLQMDFFGGVPTTYGGSNSGIAELRLARIRMDWSKYFGRSRSRLPVLCAKLADNVYDRSRPGLWFGGQTVVVDTDDPRRTPIRWSVFSVQGGSRIPGAVVVHILRAEHERSHLVAVGKFSAADVCDKNFSQHAFGRSAGNDWIWRGVFATKVYRRIRRLGLGGNDGLAVSAASAYGAQRRILYWPGHRRFRRITAEPAPAE